MRVTNQGGSLAGFIIIGVLLTLVLVGGLYGLNRYNAEKSGDNEVSWNQDSKKDDSKKNETEQKTAESSDSARQITGSSNQSDARESASPSNSQQAAQLPQTGPADSAFVLAIVGLITFVGAHYFQSRVRQ